MSIAATAARDLHTDLDATAIPGLTRAAGVGLLTVLLLLTLLFIVVAMRRLTAEYFERRRAVLIAQTRPSILQVLAGDGPDPESWARLSEVSAKVWRASEPGVVALLGKVRGGPREALVDLLNQRGTLARARRDLRSHSAIRRCRAVEMLGAAGDGGSVPVLLPLLADRQPEVRQVATRALGKIGDQAAAGPLLEAVAGPHPVPPREVSAAIVVLERAADAPVMLTASESSDSRVRSVAAEVLGLRGAMVAAEVLVHLLLHDESVEVRIRAARALGRLGVPMALKPLHASLTAPSPELRAVAARSLGQVGGRESVIALVGCMDDQAHRVCVNAAESLTALGDPGRQALRVIANGRSSRAAAYAVEALALDALGRRQLERVGI